MTTVCGFIAEVGDISRFDNPKQMQKLAGYAIVSNNSGKHILFVLNFAIKLTSKIIFIIRRVLQNEQNFNC